MFKLIAIFLVFSTLFSPLLHSCAATNTVESANSTTGMSFHDGKLESVGVNGQGQITVTYKNGTVVSKTGNLEIKQAGDQELFSEKIDNVVYYFQVGGETLFKCWLELVPTNVRNATCY